MKLREYQQDGVDFLVPVKRAILADEMGVGKTPQLICSAVGRTLVVAPPALHRNWERELAAWRDQSQIESVQIASYHALTDRTIKDGNGHVAGAVKLPWRGNWDTVIFDEAHHLKGRNTGYAKAGVKIATNSERVYLATGTPIRNWAHEIYMLLCAIYGKNDPRFSSFWRWADRWFTVYDQTRWRGRKQVTNKVVGDLRDITTWEQFVTDNGLSGRWLRRELDDPIVGLELPPMQEILIDAPMGAAHKKVYRSMDKDFFATWNGQTIMSTTEGSQWANLMRLSSGPGFHPDFNSKSSNGSAKLAILTDLVEGNQGPFVVFCWYRHTAEVLVEWFQHREYSAVAVHGAMSGANRDQAVEEFQAGAVDVLVGTYATMGEGHNLTVANKAIMFETSTVPAHVDQAKARIRRFGQDKGTTVWSLVTTGTVEEFFVKQVLPAKRNQSKAVIDASKLKTFLKERKL